MISLSHQIVLTAWFTLDASNVCLFRRNRHDDVDIDTRCGLFLPEPTNLLPPKYTGVHSSHSTLVLQRLRISCIQHIFTSRYWKHSILNVVCLTPCFAVLESLRHGSSCQKVGAHMFCKHLPPALRHLRAQPSPAHQSSPKDRIVVPLASCAS